MRILLTLILALTALTSCSKDDDGCNCKATIYKHAWSGEERNFGSEPMDCNTQEPLEPIKEDKWYFIECKQNPSY
jgi:hypothetical protein